MADENTQAQEEQRQLNSAELKAMTFTLPGQAPMSYADLMARSQSEDEADAAAEAAMAADIADDTAQRSDVKRAESDDEEEGFVPWTEADIDERAQVGPDDAQAALDSASPKLRDMNAAE